MQQDKDSKGTPPGETSTAPNTSPEQGRQPQEQSPTSTDRSSDISQVDQQEGQMNNGELGGNFDSAGDTGKQA